jgi:tRNA(Arg) A34 adenosine deaminase TadA
MDRAIELSGISTGGPFGAVIMDKTGKIIGEGHNEVTVNNDPTAHAEIVAIRRACANIDNFSLEGCTIYTSCEPCPMCLSACYWARLDKIYYANTREDAANIGFDDEYIYEEVKKNKEERKIPIIQCDNTVAKEIFRRWFENTNSIKY